MEDLIQTSEEKLFLKLEIAKSNNRRLLTEIGVLHSENDELRYNFEEKIKAKDLHYRLIIEKLNSKISKYESFTPEERRLYQRESIEIADKATAKKTKELEKKVIILRRNIELLNIQINAEKFNKEKS